MSIQRTSRVGNFRSIVRLVQSLPQDPGDAIHHKRRMLVDLCRLVGTQYGRPPAPPTVTQDTAGADFAEGLTPRHMQTLQRLLHGDSEKQIAYQLGLSPHTVHVYVKAIYRKFDVNSRGELLAQFLRNGKSRPLQPPASPE